jgi:complement component 1 Q subcomponent-binding protein
VTKEIKKMFTITDEPGTAEVKLTRKYKSEEIEIVFHCQDENSEYSEGDDFENSMEAEEGNPEEDMPSDSGALDFIVKIKKGGNTMEFFCNAGATLNITQMKFIPNGLNDSQVDALYRGPDFDNLDETLQDSLFAYLVERGIADDMSFFICSYSRDKEEREYQAWMKKFIKFVE